MKTILVENVPRHTKNSRIEAHRRRQNLARMNFNLIINKTRWKQVVIGGWKSEMAKTRTKLNKDTPHIRIMKSARDAVTGTATNTLRLHLAKLCLIIKLQDFPWIRIKLIITRAKWARAHWQKMLPVLVYNAISRCSGMLLSVAGWYTRARARKGSQSAACSERGAHEKFIIWPSCLLMYPSWNCRKWTQQRYW